jgi:hypothetical protein
MPDDSSGVEKGRTYLRLLTQAFREFAGDATVEPHLVAIWERWSCNDLEGARQIWLALPKNIRMQIPAPPDHATYVPRRAPLPDGDEMPPVTSSIPLTPER